MRLLWMTVTGLCFGLSAGLQVCYGEDFQLPLSFNPVFHKGPIYFTPHGEGRASRRIIMNIGKPNHPRLKADGVRLTLIDLRETDEGTYSTDSKFTSNTAYLTILECAEEVTNRYGQVFSLHVPRNAQYLEFTQLKRKETTVLWNRTGSKMTKGKVQMNWNVIDVLNLTQANEGYYNLRRKDNTLVKRKKLKVEANEVHYEAPVNSRIILPFPRSSTLWTVIYYVDGETKGHTLIKNGTSVANTDPNMPFKKRFSELNNIIEIYPAEITDSGYFYFKDQDGNLAQTLRLQVLDRALPPYVYIVVPILIILALISCCCVKKCFKKSSSKRAQPAPAVQYQDRTQPSVTYSVAPAPPLTSNRPVRPVAPTERAASSTGPLAAAPSQPTALPAGFNAQPSFLSTDVEPRFELKGSNFLSAPLLSSDANSAHVSTSDKLSIFLE